MNIYYELQKANSKNQNKTAMILRHDDGRDTSFTYKETFDEIDTFCASLERSGVSRGTRVAVIAESCPEWSIAYLSVVKINATAVLIDASLPLKDILILLNKSDVGCIFTSPKIFNKIIDAETPVFNIMDHGRLFDGCKSTVRKPAAADGDGAVASIIFSSGTTKTASGIMHSHDAILGSALMCIKCVNVKNSDRFLAILPNSHIYGLYTQVLGPLLVGASVCYIESMSAPCLMGALTSYHPTVFPGVPKVFELLKSNIIKKIDSDEKTKKLFEALFPVCLKIRKTTGINLGRTVFNTIHKGFGGSINVMPSAGAPLDIKTAEFYYGVGFNLLLTYGATETSIPTIGNYGKNLTTDSCGKPYPAILTKFDASGELLIKSPYMMLGYFRDENATLAAYTDDGWFKTGDLGTADEKENIRIIGRCKDNIVLATGKKVAPDDIENAYSGIDGISELVICGIPVKSGSYDTIHAFVIAQEDRKDSVSEQLKNRSKSMEQNMKLAGIHFVSEIPKTSLQKPKRFLLRQMIPHDTDVINVSSPEKSFDLESFVIKAIADITKTDISEITLKTKLFEELSLDSLSTIELSLKIEEFCGISIAGKLHRNMTVADIIKNASGVAVASEEQISDPLYPRKKRRSDYNIFNFIRNMIRGIYNVNIKNDTVLPDNSGYIICANHVTNLDFLFITLNFKKARFMNFCCMAKKELFNKSPFNKIFIQIAGLIPVDRSGNAFSALITAKDKLKEQWGILIHPEGTRSKDGQIGEFKKGAALLAIESGVPIVPAYIKGGHDIYPPSQKLPKLFNWKYFKKYTIEVIYGEPILPNGLNVDDLMLKVNSAVKSLSSMLKQ